MPNPSELGHLLRAARTQAGFPSLYAAAKAARLSGECITASQIGEWERGDVSPSVSTLDRLMSVYGWEVAIAFQPKAQAPAGPC